jgi:hypothetical protein
MAYNKLKVKMGPIKEVKDMFGRLLVIVKFLPAIIKGRVIITEDDGDVCKTFIGSSISKERFRVLLLNQIKQLKTNFGGV